MSQFDFGTINPASTSGTQLAALLGSWRDALMGQHKGSSRPAYAVAGTRWIDDSAHPVWVLKEYDGSDDIVVSRLATDDNLLMLVVPSKAGDPTSSTPYQLAFNTSSGALLFRNGADSAWVTLGVLSGSTWTPYSGGSPVSGGSFLVGEIRALAYSGSPPAGWLACDGSVVSQATYAALYALLGSTWNTGGEGAGNFRLPDARGRSLLGSGAGAGLSARTVGQTGGEESHALTSAEGPTHSHTVNDPGHQHVLQKCSGASDGIADGFGGDNGLPASPADDTARPPVKSATTGITLANSGSGTAHNTMHPFAVVQYVIRATA